MLHKAIGDAQIHPLPLNNTTSIHTYFHPHAVIACVCPIAPRYS